jgi:putative ABC transport system permease protein
MNVLECLRVALRGLTNNKMRTALTMLGIIIGVGVVILVVAIGQGATKQVTDTVNSLGTNLLTVSSNRNRLRVGTAISRTSVTSTAASGGGPTNRLTLDDVKMIASHFSKTVEAVAPQIDSGVQIRMGSIDASTQVTGTSLDYPYSRTWRSPKGAISRRRSWTAVRRSAWWGRPSPRICLAMRRPT